MSVREYRAAEAKLLVMLLNDLWNSEYSPTRKEYFVLAAAVDKQSVECMFIGKTNWRRWMPGVLNALDQIRNTQTMGEVPNAGLIQIWLDLAEYLSDQDIPSVHRSELPLSVRSARYSVQLREFYEMHVPKHLRPQGLRDYSS